MFHAPAPTLGWSRGALQVGLELQVGPATARSLSNEVGAALESRPELYPGGHFCIAYVFVFFKICALLLLVSKRKQKRAKGMLSRLCRQLAVRPHPTSLGK